VSRILCLIVYLCFLVAQAKKPLMLLGTEAVVCL
jgi:hypothetical protein